MNRVKARKIPSNRASYGTWKCKVCGMIFETKRELYDHLHKQHPDAIKRVAWNKGLTKDADDRLAKAGQKVHDGYVSGRLTPSFYGKQHSKDTKRKLSLLRKQYLAENPDKHPWRSSSKFKSVPCETFKSMLRKHGCQFEEEFKPLKDRNFSIDVMFPNLNIGFEINGNQHYDDHTKCILNEYYQTRHELIESTGIKLIEIHYANVYHAGFVEKLIREYNLA